MLEGGRDLTINMRWEGRGGGGRGKSTMMMMMIAEEEVQRRQRLGGKCDKGATKVTIAGG